MSRHTPLRATALLVAALGLSLSGAAPALAVTTLDLGTAGAFAVLAGSGITNTGRSTIVGDIGTSPLPAETGTGSCQLDADCVDLTGSNHPADEVSLQAKKDLVSAYEDAAGQPADASVPADLAGRTFTAGVYNAASSLGLTGEVTLDGQGVQGSVFIFQIGSTLTTASGSTVTLINGASACNVFWQVGSAATLGSGSTFRGTILAHDDISVNDAVTVLGRLLGGEQGSGAVTLIHDTISAPSCSTAGSTGGGTGGSTTGGGTTAGTSGSTTGGGTGGSTTGGGTTAGTSGSGTGGTPGSTGGSTTGGTPTAGASTGGGGATATSGLTSGGTTSAGTVSGSARGGTRAERSGSTPTLQQLPLTGLDTVAVAAVGVLALLVGAGTVLAARARTRV
jgi:hypothetical protein